MPSAAIIVLAGHVGSAEEIKYTQSGTALLRFSLAVNTGFGDRKVVSWYRCTMWGKRAEKLAQHVGKGTPLLVTGEPSVNEYTSEGGTKRTRIQVNVNELSFLEKRESKPEQDTTDNYQGDPEEGVPF